MNIWGWRKTCIKAELREMCWWQKVVISQVQAILCTIQEKSGDKSYLFLSSFSHLCGVGWLVLGVRFIICQMDSWCVSDIICRILWRQLPYLKSFTSTFLSFDWPSPPRPPLPFPNLYVPTLGWHELESESIPQRPTHVSQGSIRESASQNYYRYSCIASLWSLLMTGSPQSVMTIE